MSGNDLIGLFIVLIIFTSPFIFLYWFIRNRPAKKNKKLMEDIKENEKRLKQLKSELEFENEAISLFDKKVALEKDIAIKQSTLQKIKDELKEYEDDITLLEVGLYKPYFDFDTSAEYKVKILDLRNQQGDLVKSEKACICSTSWTVGQGKDAAKKGAAMTRDNIRLALRAFDGECDALISKVNSRNVGQIQTKIERSFEYINKLNARNHISIQPVYLSLKIKELKASYEYALKKEEERAEQQRIKEEMREEARAQKELEKAQMEAERAKREAERELEQARKLLEKDQENVELQAKLAELEQKLKEAEERSQRALSQAQLTKSGHVYVISNIGSFGENVFKIGMTRRLEPLDRIYELGDASVPFSFDVHAMIYSENAPALENALHKAFASHQVNRVNPRKEFFKVSLQDIVEEVRKYNAKVEFTMVAEAAEYYQSLAMEKENSYNDIIEVDDEKDLED